LNRLEEAASSTEALLQTERQEHDATKNALAQRSQELVKQAEENNNRIKQLQEEMRRYGHKIYFLH
jgi:FtsZ-binding cell division protein ZapB